MENNVQVAVRARPFSKRYVSPRLSCQSVRAERLPLPCPHRELAAGIKRVVYVDEGTSSCTVEKEDDAGFTFTYDMAFAEEEDAGLLSGGASQGRVWAQIGEPMLQAALAGFNATLFCYGQVRT